jgi:hypothetical protein
MVANLNLFACMLATYARQKMSEIHWAALLVRSSSDGTALAAIFGNDDFMTNIQSRKEVDLLRRQLREVSIEELAFGLSHDGQTWALLVKAECEGFQSAAGKDFRMEMLRAYLDDAVWAAWRTVSGEGVPQKVRPLFEVRAKQS